MAIEKFQGDYFFLSSMYSVKSGIELASGLIVPTVEHAYQAAKFYDPNAQEVILAARDGYKAKQIADGLEQQGSPVKHGWGETRVIVMTDLVDRKFRAGTRMANLLLATDNEYISEGNTRGDIFWGVDPPGSDVGLNMLGHILMDQRSVLNTATAKSKKLS